MELDELANSEDEDEGRKEGRQVQQTQQTSTTSILFKTMTTVQKIKASLFYVDNLILIAFIIRKSKMRW